jgi:hypothetical protein
MVIASVVGPEDVLIFHLRNVVMLGITLAAYLSLLYLLWWSVQRVKARAIGSGPATVRFRSPGLVLTAAVFVFVYFVWPTPWLYASLRGTPYRVNPITKETEVFMDKWRDSGNCGSMPASLRWRWRWLSGWARDIRPGQQDRQM